MNRWFMGGVLISAVIGILFVVGNTYPAIRTYNLEEGISTADNKTEEMLQELTKNTTERGMTGELTADLDKALLWFSSSQEKIKTKGEVFEDLIGYSEIKDLKTVIQNAKEIPIPLATVAQAKALILSRPANEEIKKEIARRGLEKKSATEKGIKEPLFSMLRNPEQEEVTVPVGEDSALPYTSFLLVSMIVGTLVSFMATCAWCKWAIPAPEIEIGKREEDEEEMSLAA